MSTPPRTWLTPAMVAAYLGDVTLEDDPNLVAATDGVATYLESRRSDVFGPVVNPLIVDGELAVGADLTLGGIMWSAHVYQLRSSPSGYASYGDGAGDAMNDLSLASNRGDIYRLTGVKRPVAF
jgi:hypothetical protein